MPVRSQYLTCSRQRIRDTRERVEQKPYFSQDSNLRGNPKITTTDDTIASSRVSSGVSIKVSSQVELAQELA